MNWIGLWAIYKKEMSRTYRVLFQSIASPVITTALYFVVFGAALGSRITDLGGVSYIQFIVPGLIMMALLMNSFSAAASGIYFPKFMGNLYEMLSAPLSYIEITLGFVFAAVTRAMMIGVTIYLVGLLFTPLPILHPFWAVGFSLIVSLVFALFGFIVGLWAKSFEQFNLIPTFIITPMSFLGGIFYSLDMLPSSWQTIALFNPLVYMINGLRWAFFGITDVHPLYSGLVVSVFAVMLFAIIAWIFKTGYKLRK
jgi:ABC-2 type transport system permease protein